MAITILISVFVPAIGNYQSLGLTAAEVPNVNMIAFLHLQHDIPQVRDGSLRYLELFKLAGVIAFPSFHAVSAVLFAWAFAPVRVWGPVALVLNGLMLASTPVLGGHYLVDVVGGIALAVASIAFANWDIKHSGRWRPRSRLLRNSWRSSVYQQNNDGDATLLAFLGDYASYC
jgi:hypothetical protein